MSGQIGENQKQIHRKVLHPSSYNEALTRKMFLKMLAQTVCAARNSALNFPLLLYNFHREKLSNWWKRPQFANSPKVAIHKPHYLQHINNPLFRYTSNFCIVKKRKSVWFPGSGLSAYRERLACQGLGVEWEPQSWTLHCETKPAANIATNGPAEWENGFTPPPFSFETPFRRCTCTLFFEPPSSTD